MQRLIVAGSITFLPLALSAQVLPDSGALVVTLGRDTIAVERFVRTPTRFEMVGLSRVPQTRMVRMVVSWNDAGKLTAYEVLNFAPPGGRGGARIRTVGKAVGDSVEVEMSQGDGPARVRRIPGGADVPFVNPFYSAYETAILRARANRAATVPLLGQAGLIAYNAVWSADTVTLTHPDFGTLRAVTDGSGHIRVL
ncbi:MAG TPA: hypothetical protein VK864_08795, partial [Longimicrobiales bacterium]|nr:hypothetical protein [Longimicrobiales bacterium]